MKYALIFMALMTLWYVAAVLGHAYIVWQSPNFDLGDWDAPARTLFAFWSVSTSLMTVGFTWDTDQSRCKRKQARF